MSPLFKAASLILNLALTTPIAHASLFGMAEPTLKWHNLSPKVCWGDQSHVNKSLLRQSNPLSSYEDFRGLTPFSSKQKDIIKSIVTKEYKKPEVGIEFSGWEDCSDDLTDIDVIVFHKENPSSDLSGQALIGDSYVDIQFERNEDSMPTMKIDYLRNDSSLKSFVFINSHHHSKFAKVTKDELLKITALHEFGHAAGLRHEHARLKEAKKDPNCKNFGVNLQEKEMKSTVLYGDYDPNSIMSYCYVYGLTKFTGLSYEAKSAKKPLLLKDPSIYEMTTLPNTKKKQVSIRVGLSEGDKHTLRCLYPRPGTSDEKDCKISSR